MKFDFPLFFFFFFFGLSCISTVVHITLSVWLYFSVVLQTSKPTYLTMSASGASRHIVADETYDESQDPDFTLANATTAFDEDETFNLDIDRQELADLKEDLRQQEHLQQEKKKENGENLQETAKDTNAVAEKQPSALKLPIHEKFHSFIHKHEVPRKCFHVSIGFITLYLYSRGVSATSIARPAAIAASVIFSLDLLRFNWPLFNKAYCATVGFLMREKEVNSINGVIYFLTGTALTFYFNHTDIAVMSILLLSWSDTAASTFGRAYGHLSPKLSSGKSLIGSFAAFLTGTAACYIFYALITPNFPQYNSDFQYSPIDNHLDLNTLALLSGFIAALSEGIEICGLDDNLTIPVLSGLFLNAVVNLGK